MAMRKENTQNTMDQPRKKLVMAIWDKWGCRLMTAIMDGVK